MMGGMRRLAALAAAVVVCLGLTACGQAGPDEPMVQKNSDTGIAAPTTTTVPPPTTVEGASSATTATSFLTTTEWQRSSLRQIVAPPGRVQIIFFAPGTHSRFACNILENLYGSATASELRLLPLEGAVLLPACLVGQIPGG